VPTQLRSYWAIIQADAVDYWTTISNTRRKTHVFIFPLNIDVTFTIIIKLRSNNGLSQIQ
jgi:hypothetical protein